MFLLKILLVLVCLGVLNIWSMPSEEMEEFLQYFISLRKKPASILSYLDYSPSQNTKICEKLSRVGILYAVNNEPIHSNETIRALDNSVFLLDLEGRRYLDILNKAQIKTGTLQVPSCWILFYNIKNSTKNTESESHGKVKNTIEHLITDIYIAPNTEVYLSIVNGEEIDVYLKALHAKGTREDLLIANRESEDIASYYLYKNTEEKEALLMYLLVLMRPQGHTRHGTERLLNPMQFLSGKWNSRMKFNCLHPINSSDSLAMRRRNMEHLPVATTAVYSSKQSLLDTKDFANTHVDSPAKIMYYMAVHLFEWINATGHFNITNTWGYKGSDGTFTGIMKELEDGRSDFSGSILIVSQDRMHIVEYVIPPARFDITFIFRKPALASTSNIYVLPFTNAVWGATIVLFAILTAAIIAASFRKTAVGQGQVVTAYDKVAGSIQDIICCVFQQGTAQEPVTLSGRQILFSGLLAFMFLYTAYAANVVALLQSSDNNINSVESLLNSRLQCGSHNIAYNRFIFNSDTRPAHRALWLKKGLPQGEKFYLSVDEGIRRMKKEMFAFHVDPIAGFYAIQKTFLEHEKCNIGTVKYANFKYPYFGVARHSTIKEVLRIGAIRIKESGVQDRSNRRISLKVPSCSSGTGMFTAVDLLAVAPAFQCLLALYTLALILFAIELIFHRHRRG